MKATTATQGLAPSQVAAAVEPTAGSRVRHRQLVTVRGRVECLSPTVPGWCVIRWDGYGLSTARLADLEVLVHGVGASHGGRVSGASGKGR